MAATIEMLNSTNLTPIKGGFIRPTAAERLAGRLMRAPDHTAADGASDAGGGDAAKDGASNGSGDGADAGKDGAGDGGSDAGKSDSGSAEGDDDTSLLGGAAAKAGDGDGGKDGDADGKADKGDKGEADAPPETYELKPFKVGEGDTAYEMEIDTDLLTKITPTLKDAGVSQAALDKLAPAVVPEIQTRMLQKLNDDWATTMADWGKEARADPELGKDWAKTESLAAKGMAAVGIKSEIKEVDGKKVETNPFLVMAAQTGAGNHKEFIRAFARLGEKVGEDTDVIRNHGGKQEKKDAAEILYPDDVKK